MSNHLSTERVLLSGGLNRNFSLIEFLILVLILVFSLVLVLR